MANPEVLPDPDWSTREAVPDDAEAISRLINAVTTAEIGVPYSTVEQERDHLTSPTRPDVSETIVVDADGAVIGYNQFRAASEDEVLLLDFAHPSLWGQGLSTWLIRDAEVRAGERWPGTRLQVSCFGGNERAIELFERLGYERVRTFWVMQIELDDAPASPVVDDAITIRTFEREGDERAVYAALAEAFEDHWGSEFSSFERWVHDEIEGEGSRFDPSLWFVALDGDELVGAATCTVGPAQDVEAGEVSLLGVRRAWRRRGVALALLHTAFGELHRRGVPRAQLGVDSASPTGATRLYERAGMHEIRSWEVWEKRVGV
jgi:mycothiol synthase